jgi:hypothetical protein
MNLKDAKISPREFSDKTFYIFTRSFLGVLGDLGGSWRSWPLCGSNNIPATEVHHDRTM